MVDNITPDKSGNILVEFDYNNIIVVDPNKTIDYQGNISERLVDHESLVFYANLEAYVLPRTKLALGATPTENVQGTISIASINFLKGQEDGYLTTGYFDELVGKNSTNVKIKDGQIIGGSDNQIVVNAKTNQKDNKVEYTQSVINPKDNGLLGITSINVKVNTSFIPTVTMELEDVQGKALFQLGDQSPYAAFFNLPYPPFYLTMKGYYGQAIRYQLNLKKFNARYNTFSGNYQISLEFVGFKFNILNEISIGHLLAAPHMYSRSFDISQTGQFIDDQAQAKANTTIVNGTQAEPTNSETTTVKTIISEKGYQKIVEVYSEYKSKGIIPKNFPELTLAQLMNKLEQFETTVINSYQKVDIAPLTDCRNYKDTLRRYYETVFGGNNSWFFIYMNPIPFTLKNGEKIYAFKPNKSIEWKKSGATRLQEHIQKFNKELNDNATQGKIKSKITYDVFTATTTQFQLDVVKTLEDQNGISYDGNQEALNQDIKKFFQTNSEYFKPVIEVNTTDGNIVLNLEKNVFFSFSGVNNNQRFIQYINEMEYRNNNDLANYEAAMSADLAAKIEDSKIGLGFKPTIRNFIAVIMANTEGFIRLLDDVHSKSWSLRNSPIRRRVIYNNNSSVLSSDAVDVLPTGENASNNLEDSKVPVYPWPQFFVETHEDNKKGRFQLKYPGDPTVVGFTQGGNYAIWPEVEFVEEYLKGLTKKFNAPEAISPENETRFTKILNTNAIEFPQTSLAYSNKEENKFYYEIYERQLLTTRYTGLSKINPNKLQDVIQTIVSAETKSILSVLGESNPFLTMTLKNYAQNPREYTNFLKGISNDGTGTYYQEYIRDFFVTPYIETLTNQSLARSFEIYNKGELGQEPRNSLNIDKYAESIKNNNDFTLFDTYPFTNTDWVNKNLVNITKNQGTQINNTNNVIKIFNQRNVIANFENLDDISTNRPVTSFSYTNSNNKGLLDLIPTEGYAFYNTPEKPKEFTKTTSMLNTPMFINALLDGINKIRPGGNFTYPFVTAGYLFLNSLPLITLREKYKTDNTTYSTDTDYMFATLKKYGAIHKLPYAWILKMGSLWHRYKVYKESNFDILESSWNNFNYVNYYDPVTGNPNKTYSLSLSRKDDATTTIQLENTSDGYVSLQYGFYPGLINDFNLFYNGYDLYDRYTDYEIQCSIKNGLSVYNFSDSNIVRAVEGSKIVSYKTWSVILPDNIEPLSGCDDCDTNVRIYKQGYIVPSFGTKSNATKDAITDFDANALTYFVKEGNTIENNPSVANGSVRLFWETPNYGYFDSSQLKKPLYDEYLNKYDGMDNITPFKLLNTNEYSKIEEIFSIFSKPVLDEFEKNFLDFCRSEYNTVSTNSIPSVGEGATTINGEFYNFQKLFKELMKVDYLDDNYEKYFTDSITAQKDNIYGVLNKFLTFDVLFKFGNPIGYDRRIFDSFLFNGLPTSSILDPIRFEPYFVGSLPSNGGTTTLQSSKSRYPNEWLTLELEVGFSTITELVYTNNGSYITDFFIDNNIRFSVENIKLLSFIIKMYATQKLKNPKITQQEFKNLFNDYLNQSNDMADLILNGIFTNLRRELPDLNYQPNLTIQSVIDGSQSKIENYEIFKALNDKWISGTDYTTQTLFQDIMFLDRASRNVGDILYLDIFTMKNMLSKESVNAKMSVYTFIAGLLIENNFTIMNLPGYVNFYNVQNIDGLETARPDGSLEFANNFWGTFLNVDYRNASPKMVCFYTGKPSEYLEMKNNNTFRFRSDGFEMSRSSENPLIEDLKDKKDWAFSNKCVGFNVDIGIRNQNIFYSFQVAQDTGKATSEAININLNMANIFTGRDVATQNVSLYNLYKSRSYQSTVYCLGNALLQPTMYFNLRHVPMFNGPYFITEVNHTITPGQFQTQITGTRQGIFDLPAIDSYLQSINRNLLTKIETIIKNRKEATPNENATNKQKANEKQNGSNITKSELDSCNDLVLNQYKNPPNSYISTNNVVITKKSAAEFSNLIKSNTNNTQVQAAIFALCYLLSSEGDNFVGYNNNYAAIDLTTDYISPGDTQIYFANTYSCYNIQTLDGKKTLPLVNFENEDVFMEFFVSRITPTIDLIVKTGIWNFYIQNYPKINAVPISDWQTQKKDFPQSEKKLRQGLQLAGKTGVNINFGSIDTFINGTIPPKNVKKNLNNTVQTPSGTQIVVPTVTLTPSAYNFTVKGDVICPAPTITSFTPLSGNNLTELTIFGTNLNYKPVVTIGNQKAIIKTVYNEKLIVIPPNVTGDIIVKTNGGTAKSVIPFFFLNRR